MTWPLRSERVLLALLGGMVVFALVAHALLLLHVRVPAMMLPASMVIGGLLAWRTHLQPPPDAVPAPRWLPWVVLSLLAIAAAAISYGALATPSRHWDAAAAWDTKTFYLTLDPTLQQPFFADLTVFSPARDYPLLQPLLLAAGNSLLGGNGGRLLFPVLYVLLALLTITTLRRATGNPTIAWLGTGALLLTPMLISPTSGGIDSGYADAFLLLCTTTMAAGLVLRDGRLLACGAALAVLVKPEGIVHAATAIAVTLCFGERTLQRSAAAGLTLAAMLWLPLQHQLTNGGVAPLWPYALALMVAWGTLEIADAVARRWSFARRSRLVAAAVLLPTTIVTLSLLGTWLGGASGTMHAYLHDLGQPLQQLERLPSILLAAGHYGLLRGGFGIAFWLPAVGVLVAWRRQSLSPLVPLTLFLLAGLAVAQAPFLLSPEADLDHHLRSSMPRLLLHWLGPAVLLGCVAMARSAAADGTLSAGATPTDDRQAAGAAP